jgi:DNA-binding response OmpR family regulator
MRVLVVDDHADTADALEMLLRAAGREVRAAYRGEEAIAISRRFVPEVAFVDVRLPDISGFIVAKRLRQQHGRRVNLAAITGGDMSKVRLAGCFDQHACKPLSAARVYQLLEAARDANKLVH